MRCGMPLAVALGATLTTSHEAPSAATPDRPTYANHASAECECSRK